MPSARSDIFTAVQTIAQRAGVVTVLRAPFVPSDKYDVPVPDSAYPIAAYIDNPDGETITTHEGGGFVREGVILLMVWCFTGQAPGFFSANPGPQKQLDDIADAFLDILSDAFSGDDRSILTTSLSIFTSENKPAWEPIWEYDESSHIGARLRLGYKQVYAPKPH